MRRSSSISLVAMTTAIASFGLVAMAQDVVVPERAQAVETECEAVSDCFDDCWEWYECDIPEIDWLKHYMSGIVGSTDPSSNSPGNNDARSCKGGYCSCGDAEACCPEGKTPHCVCTAENSTAECTIDEPAEIP